MLDLAVIGGTGLYALAELENVERHNIQTPFGAASDGIVVGYLGKSRIAFLARHGEAHMIAPHQVNYRANLWALHSLGAKRVLAVNAVGGIRADMGPRVLVLPDQIIDYTWGRISSFSDQEGVQVRHIDFSHPYSAEFRSAILQAAKQQKIDIVADGCFAITQGPRLETAAEVKRLRRDGCDLIGMTGMPEAVLARELDLQYACVAMVANWAAGCVEEEEISIDEIYANLAHTTNFISRLIKQILGT